MSIEAMGLAKRAVRALSASTTGATAFQYVMVLGVVTLTGAVAFGQFSDDVRLALYEEQRAVDEWSDEAEGPVGSLAQEVATAGAEALVVQGSWALAAKAGTKGLAAARKKQRGRGSSTFQGDRALAEATRPIAEIQVAAAATESASSKTDRAAFRRAHRSPRPTVRRRSNASPRAISCCPAMKRRETSRFSASPPRSSRSITSWWTCTPSP